MLALQALRRSEPLFLSDCARQRARSTRFHTQRRSGTVQTVWGAPQVEAPFGKAWSGALLNDFEDKEAAAPVAVLDSPSSPASVSSASGDFEMMEIDSRPDSVLSSAAALQAVAGTLESPEEEEAGCLKASSSVVTPSAETTGKVAKEKNTKKNAEKKCKKKRNKKRKNRSAAASKAWLFLKILPIMGTMAEYWKHACMLLLTHIAVPSPITLAFYCCIAEIKAPTFVGARKIKATKKDGKKKDVKKTAKKKAKTKRKKVRKKGCQPSHQVELNALKAEAVFRSLWNRDSMRDHTKEQACEVLAKFVDCRHITGKDFEHCPLVQEIKVFLKQTERVHKAFKRCVGALCCWSAAGASQQQRKPGQDTAATRTTPPAARPASKLGVIGTALLTGLAVLSLFVASCACIVPAFNTGLVDLNAASMANPAASRPQDCCGWLLVLLVLRAFGVWGVACVVQQQQNRHPDRERACGAAGDTICLNPGKGAGGEAADSRSCSGGGVAPRALLVTFAAQNRNKRARMSGQREKRRNRRASKAEWRETLQCAAHPGSHFKFNGVQFVGALNTVGGVVTPPPPPFLYHIHSHKYA
jgi:hypothetical protein